MASLSVRCGVTNHPSIHHRLAVERTNPNPNRIAPFQSSRRAPPRISAATTTADYPISTSCSVNQEGSNNNNGALFSSNLDEWMRDSAAEIVKNLREAPLFVQIYAANNGGATRLETEKAVAEDWPVVARRWKDGDTPSPDGLILVEELGGGDEEEEEEERVTRAWGVVVQGKGVECGPVCYLLKTSRVVGSGLGLCCTHFCLMKVQGFRESALSQLTNCWLLD
ncbi:unnamed protein product [Camellia sinensis]|uniref:DUF7804 domain-containing protein n=1 Tax=Camellia sinensis var. sinensis TaxID=542762 RepID=A0A4S4ENL5_CAMSN|nr:uncharacterized protein LOC114264417 [Camellia sinensis]THG18289.1 hypothetical protein TEA_023059 [Camellia sinensis var. sinensis]